MLALAVTCVVLASGCMKPSTKYNYGPDRKAAAVTLDQSQEAAQVASQAVAADTGEAAGHIHFMSDLTSAQQDAQNTGGRRKILLFITNGTSEECRRFEAMLSSPEVQKEARNRWIFVKHDIRYARGYLSRYKIEPDDLPVAVIVSPEGNENGRITSVPSSAAVLATIMNDRW